MDAQVLLRIAVGAAPDLREELAVRHRPAGVRDEGPARLRPDLEWLDNRGIWSWSKNPFVGTQPYRGLLVLMMVLNSTDLKDDNNTLYFARRPPTRPVFWYAVKDLGELVVVAAISAVLLVAIAAISVMVLVTVFGPAMLNVFDPLRGH